MKIRRSATALMAALVVGVAACAPSATVSVTTTTANVVTGGSESTTTMLPSNASWTTGRSWAWILQEGSFPRDDVDVIDVDLFSADPSDVRAAEDAGILTVCYVSVGTYEQWRPDADDYPEEILGNVWDEWGETYVDIRRLDVLGPILEERLDLCASKGFSAVEPDNLDTYGADTGFDLNADDALMFARWIADEAHLRGLSVGQKNVPEFAGELVDSFDFAITEDCFDDGWCAEMAPYRSAGKAILDAEYTDRMDSLAPGLCGEADDLGISVLLADRELTENIERCP